MAAAARSQDINGCWSLVDRGFVGKFLEVQGVAGHMRRILAPMFGGFTVRICNNSLVVHHEQYWQGPMIELDGQWHQAITPVSLLHTGALRYRCAARSGTRIALKVEYPDSNHSTAKFVVSLGRDGKTLHILFSREGSTIQTSCVRADSPMVTDSSNSAGPAELPPAQQQPADIATAARAGEARQQRASSLNLLPETHICVGEAPTVGDVPQSWVSTRMAHQVASNSSSSNQGQAIAKAKPPLDAACAYRLPGILALWALASILPAEVGG